ncbi:MAG: hypothetical protein IPN14_08730 [Bacteroidetes bacterium]|nr:hypothetical protein [Bacteroidota bacterium]
MKKLSLVLVFSTVLFIKENFAQYQKSNLSKEKIMNTIYPSSIQSTPLFKEISHNSSKLKWGVNVRNTSERKHFLPEVEALKEMKNLLKFAQPKTDETEKDRDQ